MPQTLIPIHIKPHLIPFLFKKLKCEQVMYEGSLVKAAKVDNRTNFGRIVRLLLEKSERKVKCDTSRQSFFVVRNRPDTACFMGKDYKYQDGRTGFLYLPEAGEQLINEILEDDFETACMFYIHSRHKSNSTDSLDAIILDFFNKYNLEEFDFNILRIRRDYYRKVKDGYFRAKVFFDPLSETVRTAY